MLPRLRHVFEQHQALHRLAVEAIVSEEAPSQDEVIDALRDLVLESVEVFPDNHVVLGLTDSCGLHFMDGYWPAVRFNGGDGVVEVTVES